MSDQQQTAGPVPPELIKKVEQEILSEAKNEEKSMKNAIKDLTQTEKQNNHAQKVLVKADKGIEKAEKREQNTLKDVYRAEHRHDVAFSTVKSAQHELEVLTKGYEKTQESLGKKSARVDAAMKAHEEHTQLRNSKLNALRGPSAPEEAGRVVAETVHQPEVHDINAQTTAQYPRNNV